MMALRAQNAKLRDQIASLVFQQCLADNPPRQAPSEAQQPYSALSASQMLRADSAPSTAQSTASLARAPSASLTQSTLFRAPSGQMTKQLSSAQSTAGASAAQLSQQMTEERKRYGQAVNAKDERIRELDQQLRAFRQAQRAENQAYKSRSGNRPEAAVSLRKAFALCSDATCLGGLVKSTRECM